jgi:hypothetical protein
LVSTVAPPIWAVFSAVADAAELGDELDAELGADEDAGVDGALAGLDELDELLHAPAVRTAPANAAAASHLLRMAYLPPEVAGPIPAPEISTPSAIRTG